MFSDALLWYQEGLERMNYQGPLAPLPLELIKLFNEVLVYKESIQHEDNRTIIKQTRSYVRSNDFLSRFKNILDTHTGLDVKIKLGVGPSYFFAVYTPKTIQMIRSTLDSLDETYVPKTKDKIGERRVQLETALEEIRNSIDKGTAKLIDSKTINKIGNPKCTLYFDIDAAFNLENFHEQATPLTSKEITAIVLHEIGHVLSFIANASTLTNTITEVLRPVAFSANTLKGLNTQIKEYKAYYAKFSKENPDFKLDDITQRTLLQMEQLTEDMPKSPLWEQALCNTIGALILILGFPVWAFRYLIDLMLTEGLENLISKNNNASKTSDFKRGWVDITNTEYQADQFVATYGLSDALISSLFKLREMSKLVSGSGIKFVHPSQSMLRYCALNSLTAIMAAREGYSIGTGLGYGTPQKRFDSIRMNALEQLKTEDLPKEVIQDILTDYANVETVIETRKQMIKRTPGMRLFKLYTNTILKLRGGLVDFFSGNHDYAEIFALAKEFQNSRFIYQVKRLENS